MSNVAIIGFGVVGKGMAKIFPDAIIYDKKFEMAADEFKTIDGHIAGGRNFINKNCQLAIICVPTPPKTVDPSMNGHLTEEPREADTSAVEEVIRWLDTQYILIKSTVPPGTTQSLQDRYGKRICFSPEYLGESRYYTPPEFPDPNDPRQHSFMVIGGTVQNCNDILNEFFIPRLGPTKHYHVVSHVEAELIKYMENTFFAMKVTYANEWYDVCQTFGADYLKVREGWLFDERVGRMHTSVFEKNRGYAGKCYPKDVMAIIAASKKAGYNPELLEAVHRVNGKMRSKNLPSITVTTSTSPAPADINPVRPEPHQQP